MWKIVHCSRYVRNWFSSIKYINDCVHQSHIPPPKPIDEFNLNSVYKVCTEGCQASFYLALPSTTPTLLDVQIRPSSAETARLVKEYMY